MEPGGEHAPRQSPRRLRAWADVLGATVLLALLLRLLVLDAYRIPSASMANTLLPGDFLLVNKMVFGAATPQTLPFTSIPLPHFRFPGFSSPSRGDVVVFSLDGTTYVKRCVGLPGDTVEVRGDVAFINGREVPVPGSARASGTEMSRAIRRVGPVIVPRWGDVMKPRPESALFLVRLIEREGHGAVLASGGRLVIDGRLTDSYTVQGDHYFVLGDNRENSLDSRVAGFIPASGIIGKAMLVYWSRTVPGEIEGGQSVRWSRLGKIVR
jgi:signal peptidase I